MIKRFSIGDDDETHYIPDTSAIINGGVSKLLRNQTIKSESKITIHAALLSELENQANSGRQSGFKGIAQLKKINEYCIEKGIEFNYAGRRPNFREFDYIDAIIRDYAWKESGILVTSDSVQNLSALSIGIKTIFIKKDKIQDSDKSLGIENYFDAQTMSIHIKQGSNVYVKKGKPGEVSFIRYSDQIITKEEIKEFTNEIIEKAEIFPDAFVEIDRENSTIVQYEDKRIVITRPPFSDGWEITAVRPLKRLLLKDYNLPGSITQRLEEKAEGILVAGRPGAGKTTFTRALALYYESKGKILKTIESPRDLDLKVEITQYSKNFGSHSEIHDILLLSRPDYTIFDEIRDRDDFRLYTDLRLAGIGLIGVIHSSTAIDAIQRFIGRLELGVIPSVLDTILYIDAGTIKTVLEVKMTVKVPTGLMESDLARPVIEVRDFISGEIMYEMYTFGEQTVVIPIQESVQTRKKVSKKDISSIKKEVEHYTKHPVSVISKDNYGYRFSIHSEPDDIPLLIGPKGSTIKALEKVLNVKLDVEKNFSHIYPTNELSRLKNHYISIQKRTITINFPKRHKNKEISFFMPNESNNGFTEFFVGTTSKSGKIKISTKSEIGQIFQNVFESGNRSIYWK
ncbi:MAG: ATPase, T2SS/T4P/T4SS family [Candidatus Hodarchaeales archaeon]